MALYDRSGLYVFEYNLSFTTYQKAENRRDTMIYDFMVKNTDSGDVNLSDYKGIVLLIVNTATGCGLTPQYKGLQGFASVIHQV